jgi:hypothetical protein
MCNRQAKKRIWLLASTVLMLALVTPACGETASPAPKPTTGPGPTHTLMRTNTPRPTKMPSATPTHTPTLAPTDTATPRPTRVPSLSGRVTDAATGQGIAGATIEAGLATQLSEFRWAYSATTASDGSYAMFGLPAGDYIVRITASGYAWEYWDNATLFTKATVTKVSSGATTPSIDFVLTEGGSISGHIYQSDGVTPIEGAQVFVESPVQDGAADTCFSAITDAEGAYKIEGLSLGNFKVRAEAPDRAGPRYYNGAEGVYGICSAADVMVTPPATTSDVDISLQPGGSISGHVYRSDGITPVGVYLVAEGTDVPCTSYGTHSNSQTGYYIIRGLPPGHYKLLTPGVTGSGGGFYDSKPDRSSADVVAVAQGEVVIEKDFVLQVGASLRGHIYDEAGEPISGAFVEADIAGGEWVGSGGNVPPSGSYEIYLSTGDYKICAVASGYVAECYNDHYDRENADLVHVDAPSEVSGIDFYLAKAGSISGHVYEADGTIPIASANVYAFSITGDHPGAGANSGPDGSYTIQGLPSGNYRVQATVSGHESQFYSYAANEASATEVTVNAPNDAPGIDFALSSFTGNVRWARALAASITYFLRHSHNSTFIIA